MKTNGNLLGRHNETRARTTFIKEAPARTMEAGATDERGSRVVGKYPLSLGLNYNKPAAIGQAECASSKQLCNRQYFLWPRAELGQFTDLAPSVGTPQAELRF